MLNKEQKACTEKLIKKVGDECIFPYFKNLKESDVSYKGGSIQDPVSIVDKEAENLLQKGLASILPDSLFIGEELFAKNPQILNHLKQNDNPIWIVDPIDGTHNFISGRQGFGIMICLVSAGGDGGKLAL